MYGPVGMQVHAGSWEHEALREANGHRRSHTDTDYLKVMENAEHRAAVTRIVATAVTVLVALTIIVLI